MEHDSGQDGSLLTLTSTTDENRPSVPVAAVIPTYNHAKFLPQALDSILRQTVRFQEILVVDDGSTDNTGDVLRPYVERGEIEHVTQSNAGHAAARNTGIRKSKAPFLAFLDSDDWWLPTKTEAQLEVFRRLPETGVVTCPALVDDGIGGRVLRPNFAPDQAFLELLCRGNVFGGSCSSALVRRKCFDELGVFDPSFRISQDWDMWMRVARRYPIRWTTEPGTVYRLPQSGQSLSARVDLMEREMKEVLKGIFSDPELPEAVRKIRTYVYCHHLVIIGKSYLKQGKVWQGFRLLAEAGARSPWRTAHSLRNSRKDSERLDSRLISIFARR